MKSKFNLFRRGGVFYIEDTTTGKQTSLRTKDETEAKSLLNARNEAQRQPVLNLHLARAYLTASDPALPRLRLGITARPFTEPMLRKLKSLCCRWKNTKQKRLACKWQRRIDGKPRRQGLSFELFTGLELVQIRECKGVEFLMFFQEDKPVQTVRNLKRNKFRGTYVLQNKIGGRAIHAVKVAFNKPTTA